MVFGHVLEHKAMIGAYAFMIGLVIAVVLGIWPELMVAPKITNTILVLGILGIIVGLLNIEDKELVLYIVANVGFVVGSAAFIGVLAALPLGIYGSMLVYITQNIILFVAPGVAVVSLKAIYQISKE
jgi:hypothetical protein